MTEWIDVTVYAILTFSLWFVLPVIHKHFIVPVIADRNPDWLAANSGAVTTDNRRFLWSSYALGALSLAALVWAMLGARPQRWMLLRDINVCQIPPAFGGPIAEFAYRYAWPAADDGSAIVTSARRRLRAGPRF